MSRRKLTIVIVLGSAAAAGVIAILAFRAPTLWDKFNRVHEGMTYDEVVAILGERDSPEVLRWEPWWREGDRRVILLSGCPVSWYGPDGEVLYLYFDTQKRVREKHFIVTPDIPDTPPSFLDRILGWFGL